MSNKWLAISAVSTAFGIIAGVVYLLFAEHSLLMNEGSWQLSTFWSAFMLWAFVLMFVVALLFNVLAFLELDQTHDLVGMAKPLHKLLSTSNKQQQFLQDAKDYVSSLGKVASFNYADVPYQCLGEKELLIYVHNHKQLVDISQIRNMFQHMLASNYGKGLVLSYAGFSSQVWIFAQEANIQLIDAKSLKKRQKNLNEQKFALVLR